MLQSLHQQTCVSSILPQTHIYISSSSQKYINEKKTFIFVKYALKVKRYSLNLALPWPPTDVVGREFPEVALRNSFVENFASKTHLMTFKLRNGSDGGEREAVEEHHRCSRHAENVWMLASW